MIIENGEIQFMEKTGGGLDPATGFPRPADKKWGEPIGCQIVPNRSSLLGKANGESFTSASYTVFLEEQPLPESEQVRLRDEWGAVVGEFSLLSKPERLRAVGEIRLTV